MEEGQIACISTTGLRSSIKLRTTRDRSTGTRYTLLYLASFGRSRVRQRSMSHSLSTDIWMGARSSLMEAIACGLFTVSGHGSLGCCRRHVLYLTRSQTLDILPGLDTCHKVPLQGCTD